MTPTLTALKERVRLLEKPAARHDGHLPFGIAGLDAHLPDQGLARAALHEVSGESPCATLFVAGLLARLDRAVLWCARTPDLFAPDLFAPDLFAPDLFAPGLAGAGLKPDRVLYAQAPDEKTVLLAMEEALRHQGLAAVVGEVSRLPMTASRRLTLAAEKSGVMAVALRRAVKPEAPAPNAARTRWRISPLPSAPLTAPGIGRARWRVELTRCRGGNPGTWIMEACDAQGYLAVPAELADGSAQAARGRAA
jgi:protein ImuA